MADGDDLIDAVLRADLKTVHAILAADPNAVHARDATGATALHYATESGNRDIVTALLDAGADINARDARFNGTPAGWAIEFLRERGALLGMEIDDVAYVISIGNEAMVERYLTRLPALRDAADRAGVPLKTLANRSGNAAIAKLFGNGGSDETT